MCVNFVILYHKVSADQDVQHYFDSSYWYYFLNSMVHMTQIMQNTRCICDTLNFNIITINKRSVKKDE